MRIPSLRRFLRPVRESLLARLVVVFVLFSALIVALLGTAGYLFLTADLRGTVAAQLNALGDLCETSLEKWVDEQARTVDYMARLPAVQKMASALLPDPAGEGASARARSEMADFFSVVAEGHAEFREICLLAPTGGLVVFSTTGASEGQYRVTDSAFVRGRTGLHVQSVHPSPATLLPTLTISAPVLNAAGVPTGVLAVDLNLDSMDRLVQVGTGLGRGEESYLVDRFHVFVSSQRFGREDYPRGIRSMGVDAATGGVSGRGEYLNYRGIRVIGAFRWIGDLQLALLVEVPSTEAFAAVRDQTALISIIGLFFVGILAAGVYLIGSRIARPIAAVQRAAALVAEGKLDAEAPVVTEDEIGKLAVSFNLMTERLRGMYGEVRLREEHFRSLIDASSDIIVVVDDNRRLSFVSPSVERVLGWRSARHVGTDPFMAVHPADRSRVRGELQRLSAAPGGSSGDTLFRCRHSNGEWRTLAAAGRNMLAHSSIRGIVVNARDITEARKAEDERARLEEQLRQAQKMESIGRLAGGIAHDINNLLTPILGYTELMRDGMQPADPWAADLEQIQGAAQRARDLTRQLLAFSRKQILSLAPLDLRDVVRGFEKLLRRSIREDIRIQVKLPAVLGIVEADAGQVEHVLMNLCVNAQDAMPDGGTLCIELRDVTVEAAPAPPDDLTPGDYVLLSVSDTGRGMDQMTMRRLFEPFFTTKGLGKGTGLGLSMAYGIIRQHGGRISARSVEGSGATFDIMLPRRARADTGTGEGSAAKAPALRGGETILVVEDTAMVRELACRVLQRQGYNVIQAETGEQAVACAAEVGQVIHLLLTDVVMPGINGRELYQRLAAARPELRVLYMSGYTDEVIAHRGVLDKRVSFIQKPFTVEGFAQKVREVLEADSPSSA